MIDLGDINWLDYLQTNSFSIPFLAEENKSVIPNLYAKSAILYDINKNNIIYAHQEDKQLPIASLTKLMTALVILEENNPYEVFKVPVDTSEILGSKMNLNSNDQITVYELLHGLLIASGNDAAFTLAKGNAKSTSKFVEKMNKKAKRLGLENTRFSNPAGFDSKNNYSTAQDLLIVAKELLQYPLIHQITSKETHTSQNYRKNRKYQLTNTNQELNNFLNIKGLKTGKTPAAQECFIGVTNSENPKISIILGSKNRFLDTKSLIYLFN